MKKIVILTDHFPLGKGETFLKTEIEYFKNWDVSIFVLSEKENLKSENLPENIKVFVAPNLKNNVQKIICFIKALFNVNLYKEICHMIENRKMNLSNIKEAIYALYYAEGREKKIKEILLKSKYTKDEKIIFYSYWMYVQPIINIYLKKYFMNSTIVCRCHRYDLYENENQNKYLPMRKFILKCVDYVFPISRDGEKYLKYRYPEFDSKIEISRLGTKDLGEKCTEKKSKLFTIVSCSNVIKVKRLELIVGALALLKDIQVLWMHFGDGDMFQTIKNQAKEKLSSNIQFEFKGYTDNQEILERYRSENIHLFINVSESEGIPVSIMEAMSFGIPTIATDVGGTKEIVKDGCNGKLLNKDFSISDLTKLIKYFYLMEEDDYQKYRRNARNYWNKNFNADTNYRNFIERLEKL